MQRPRHPQVYSLHQGRWLNQKSRSADFLASTDYGRQAQLYHGIFKKPCPAAALAKVEGIDDIKEHLEHITNINAKSRGFEFLIVVSHL